MAAAAAHPSISMKADPGVLYYTQPPPSTTRIAGRLSSGKRGVLVTLEALRWPFGSHFTKVSQQKTGGHGQFSFKRRPSLATEYRVIAPKSGLRSAIKTVYVTQGYTHVMCRIISKRKSYPCVTYKSHVVPTGPAVVEFSYDGMYPASAYRTESAKPAFVYYGQVNRENAKPHLLTFRKTVPQHPRKGNRTHVSVKLGIRIPSSGWAFLISACIQTTEETDGFGLPGAPGSHHCGSSAITYRQSQSQQGLG